VRRGTTLGTWWEQKKKQDSMPTLPPPPRKKMSFNLKCMVNHFISYMQIIFLKLVVTIWLELIPFPKMMGTYCGLYKLKFPSHRLGRKLWLWICINASILRWGLTSQISFNGCFIWVHSFTPRLLWTLISSHDQRRSNMFARRHYCFNANVEFNVVRVVYVFVIGKQ
jgi:hypothetical protein